MDGEEAEAKAAAKLAGEFGLELDCEFGVADADARLKGILNQISR